MRLLRWLQLFAAGMCGAVLVACALPSGTVNYEVVAELIVHGQHYQGRGVWGLSSTLQQGLPNPNFRNVTFGEAIRVPLADGRTIYLLRRGQSFKSTAFGNYLWNCIPQGTKPIDVIASLDTMQGPCPATRGLPMMVIFSDEADPSSAEVVLPYLSRPVQAETCEGICIVELTATRTGQPVTAGIVEHLPWLRSGVPGTALFHDNPTDFQAIKYDDFTR